MSTVRAKFLVSSKTQYASGSNVRIEMTPVYSQDPEHENKRFWDATPSGKCELSVKFKVGDLFEVGKEYYLDFIPA